MLSRLNLIRAVPGALPRALPRVVSNARVAAVARPTLFVSAQRWYSDVAPLTLQQVEDRVMQVLREFSKVDRSKLALDAHFVNDLGLDSLDHVEVTMALEDEFSVEFPDHDVEMIMTPRQAIEKIYANKEAL
ncbi:Acyl carrier protein 1, mitochondrial [Borealophlyctis nickersoniae]|nr:Acyl carrier protein 1, mitochondrial [Borealophlyctis nickersoniae]